MIGVVSFPGSNGDHDALYALRENVGVPARIVDHRETDLSGLTGVVLPGGFTFGDALRCGALARFSPVMTALRDFVKRGGPVLGICNGFQILTEAHLLPGALVRNRTLRFHCHVTPVRIEGTPTAWTEGCRSGDVLMLPVAHGEGAFEADDEELRRWEGEGMVVARYVGSGHDIAHEINTNGSRNDIAGICNKARNVVGLMPHPERAADGLVGGSDGLMLLRAALTMTSSPVGIVGIGIGSGR